MTEEQRKETELWRNNNAEERKRLERLMEINEQERKHYEAGGSWEEYRTTHRNEIHERCILLNEIKYEL